MESKEPKRPEIAPLVLVVDDDPAMRDSLDAYLSMKGMHVRTYESAAALLNDAFPRRTKIMIIDVNMPGMDGFELLGRLRSRLLDIPAIMISGRFSPEARQRADSAGIISLIEKPIDHHSLMNAIKIGLETA
jgi:FixJ family two-component response regulator